MYDVVIIGAGIAGLAAARVLSLESYKVIVLEARDRPGGRIHTVRLPELRDCHSSTNSTLNHDNLSVHHVQNVDSPLRPVMSSGTRHLTSESCDSSTSQQTQSTQSPPTDGSRGIISETVVDSDGPVDIDLGANYLIGCSNRQTDQPLFHMARLLSVPTATAAGDLCKKYRGWECAELATWRDHCRPGAPIIPIEKVADAVFLFDKMVHLAVHNHLKLKAKLEEAALDDSECAHLRDTCLEEPSVNEFLTEALTAILQSEALYGVRPAPTFRDETEEGIFNSIVTRYLAYVNPLDRLPHTVLDELYEVANPRWRLSIDGYETKVLGVKAAQTHKFSLADQLALAYPSVEQREAYQVWAKRKFEALATGQSGSCPAVARTVNVSWEDRLVTGRFCDLLKPLIDDVEIVYNAVVSQIDWSLDSPATSRVRVKACVRDSSGNLPEFKGKNTEETMVFEAKHCIITVPVGVLKGLDPRSSIVFNPPLPDRKRLAIERLAPPERGAATHEKVILRFRVPQDVFWDADAAHLKCPDPRLHILNLHRYGKPGILCAHIWGGSGLCTAGKSDREIVDTILDLLDAMYPMSRNSAPGKMKRAIPNPVYYLVTHWSDDPFALGAYTTGEPGSSDADRLAYAASLTDKHAREQMDHSHEDKCARTDIRDSKLKVPRLLFAGEGTLTAAEAKECTHGALQTGVMRAVELLPFLAKFPSSIGTGDSGEIHSSICEAHSYNPVPLHKLAHYLVGKRMARWMSYTSELNSSGRRGDLVATRYGRRTAQQQQLKQPVRNEGSLQTKPRLSSRQNSRHRSAVRCTGRRSRPRHSRCPSRRSVDTDSNSTLSSEPGLMPGSCADRLFSRPNGRAYSHSRAGSFCARAKRARRAVVRDYQRKYVEISYDSMSDASSTTVEARTSCEVFELNPTSSRPPQTSPLKIDDIRNSWHKLPAATRHQTLIELSDLLNELRAKNAELDNVERLSSLGSMSAKDSVLFPIL
ncbi:unnamed protein product [Calicophoron daubneyi]|uniref:Amine oxidase domain-containing protein n=1 Tax=Calicophoron daubneyi TaxID=300641 RepID=A0AAV2TCM1_CALDB